jgi:putative MFS transporter
MVYISFASNFAYYGMVYGLPHTLRTAARREEANSDAWSPAAGVFFSALFEIPGVFLAIVLGITLRRKLNILVTFFSACACLSLLIYALWTEQTDTIGMWAIFGVKMFIAAGFIVVYLYLLECYPTIFRATGLAFCMVVGRLGGFCCPFLHDGLVVAGWHYAWFFVAMAGTLFLAALVSICLPFETKDAPLSDI